MQIKLEEAGYAVDEDELRWWMFGMSTQASLRTFQACEGLPESGVSDERTWSALMPPGAAPQDIASVWSGASDDDDLSQTSSGRVWLVGEQRWSKF